MSLLQVNSMSAWYGDFQALFGINFKADAGETVAIIGANGAGKTTFLKALAGVVPVERDSIRFEGRSIGGDPAKEAVRRGIAMVPEGRRLFPSLNVRENLQMGAYCGRPGEWTMDRVTELFPRVGERLAQMPSSMSGGEQQMVAIGRALLSNPRVLMCDELSLGLAPTVIKDIYKHLAKVKARGTTLIIVEQDIQQALAVADRVYCFQEGRVSLEGAPGELGMDRICDAYFGMERAAA